MVSLDLSHFMRANLSSTLARKNYGIQWASSDVSDVRDWDDEFFELLWPINSERSMVCGVVGVSTDSHPLVFAIL